MKNRAAVHVICFCMILTTKPLFAMDGNDTEIRVIVDDKNKKSFEKIQDLQIRLIEERPLWLACDEPDFSKEYNYWSRLAYLSILHNIDGASPFNVKQQKVFDEACSQGKRANYILVGGIVVGVICECLGFLSFLGLLGNNNLSTVLTSSILPTTGLLGFAFGLWGTSYKPYYSNAYEGLALNLHERIIRELEQLAYFLIQKSFGKDPDDRENAAQIVRQIDIPKLQEIYARQANAPTDQGVLLVEPLEEAIFFLKNREILGKSFNIFHEIRLCLSEQGQNLKK